MNIRLCYNEGTYLIYGADGSESMGIIQNALQHFPGGRKRAQTWHWQPSL